VALPSVRRNVILSDAVLSNRSFNMLPARGLRNNRTGILLSISNVHSTVSTQQISDGRFARKKRFDLFRLGTANQLTFLLIKYK